MEVMRMNWQEICIKTKHETVETISNLFYELGAGGVVIEDPAVIEQYIAEHIWDYYELPVGESDTDSVIIKAYLPVNENLPTKLEDLQHELEFLRTNYYPEEKLQLRLTEVSEEDWANSWKAYFKPEKIGEKIVIKPSWEDYSPKGGELVIELDPGMAFGTGNHPTTSMCIKALEKYLKAGNKVYDVGTGSGVLAIAASLLGANEVIAVDIDDVAVKVAQDNVEANKLQNKVQVLQGNLLDLLNEKADIIVANIIADIIIAIVPDVMELLKEQGYFIASGIIKERKDDVLDAFQKSGIKVVTCLEQGEWVAFVGQRG